MLVIDYYQQDYTSFIKTLAPKVNGRFLSKYAIDFDVPATKGFARAEKINEGLTYLIFEAQAYADVFLKLYPDDGIYYLLLLKEDINLREDTVENKMIFFTDTVYSQSINYSQDTKTRVLSICIKKEWLLNLLVDSNESIQAIQSLNSFIKIMFDNDYQYIFNDILKLEPDNLLSKLHEQNRVLQLLEMFLKRAIKMSEKNTFGSIKKEERKIFLKIEQILLKDLSGPPPSLKTLAQTAYMSESSLKSKFKMIFGTSISNYYMQCKMNKAKELLISKKYSVKEVGLKLGYSNLGHFAKAFKKEFNKLPSEL